MQKSPELSPKVITAHLKHLYEEYGKEAQRFYDELEEQNKKQREEQREDDFTKNMKDALRHNTIFLYHELNSAELSEERYLNYIFSLS